MSSDFPEECLGWRFTDFALVRLEQVEEGLDEIGVLDNFAVNKFSETLLDDGMATELVNLELESNVGSDLLLFLYGLLWFRVLGSFSGSLLSCFFLLLLDLFLSLLFGFGSFSWWLLFNFLLFFFSMRVQCLVNKSVLFLLHSCDCFFVEINSILSSFTDQSISVSFKAALLKALPVSLELVDRLEDLWLLFICEVTILAKQINRDDKLAQLGGNRR